jgi:hypothetical protein
MSYLEPCIAVSRSARVLHVADDQCELVGTDFTQTLDGKRYSPDKLTS